MEKKEKFSKKITIIFFIIFLTWSILQILSPIMTNTGSVGDLSGYVGVNDNDEKNIDPPWSSVYNCGDVLCHQKHDRSFIINNNQMPFCARCTAIFFGITIGIFIMIFIRLELDSKIMIIMVLSLIPIGIDGFGQLIGLWESSNLSRVITGLLIGIVSGIAIGIIIDETYSIYLNKKTKTN